MTLTIRLALLTFALAATGVQAQEIGDAEKGARLVSQLCADCHAIYKRQTNSPNANAPRFATMAAAPGITAAALYSALQTSHPTMPNVILQPDDKAHIIAYILSLGR